MSSVLAAIREGTVPRFLSDGFCSIRQLSPLCDLKSPRPGSTHSCVGSVITIPSQTATRD